MKNIKWGGRIKRLALIATALSIFTACSSKDPLSSDKKAFYIKPTLNESISKRGVELTTGKLNISKSDIFAKANLALGRVLNDNNNSAFGNFATNYSKSINKLNNEIYCPPLSIPNPNFFLFQAAMLPQVTLS